NEVLPAERCSYVLGNPPFIGKKEQTPQQKADFEPVMNRIKGFGVLDFVAAWYVKAADYMRCAVNDAAPRVAFVSTNSITQGEQVGVLWAWMLAQGIHIQFAHRTFSWSNEAKGNAAVHCVIVGFGREDCAGKIIYEYADIKGEPLAVSARNINPYLVDAPNVALAKVTKPICAVPDMMEGSALIDDGHFMLTHEEAAAIIDAYPLSKKWIRQILSGEDFINGRSRQCLWLATAAPAELRQCTAVMHRVEKVKSFRKQSNRLATQKLADTPTLFGEVRQPQYQYLFVPKTSSERREYVPIGFVSSDVIINNTSLFVDQATPFHFGILSSTMHNAWMRATCGRLESRFRYSSSVVYNNYPWPGFAGEPLSDKHRTAIEQAAQCVLDARAQFASSSLADLYDPLTMPPALLKAHQKLDTAVDAAYQPSGGKKSYASDAERVAF
ncbi:MAG: type IIL restriction-modification enzyme MmeI, partial [Limnohabitans sp.]